MDIIDLPELGMGTVIEPGEVERRALLKVGRHLNIDWLPGGRVRVKPNGFVGSLRLSDERILRVTTKVPVANLFGLVSLAYKSMPVPGDVGTTLADESEPLDWLTLLLICEIEALLAHDPRHGYMDVEQALPYIRGRIQFHRQVGIWGRPGFTQCWFSEFTPDTSENRVLRATLESVITLPLHPGLRGRAEALTRMLSGVTPVPLSRALFASTRMTRLTQAYGPALDLCRLYFENSGVDEVTGAIAAPSFFFPMAEVFEKAVANSLTRHLSGVRLQTRGILRAIAGGPSHTFNYTPDIVVGNPARLVLDTKYAAAERVSKLWGGPHYENQHAYQIVFYGMAHGCPGVLIYPRVDHDIDVTYELAGQQFRFITVDLQQSSLGGLDVLADILNFPISIRERRSLGSLTRPADGDSRLAFMPASPAL